MFTKTFSNILATAFLLFFSNSAVASEKLDIHDAWAREAPPSTPVMAAYLTLHNHSSKSYILTHLSSPDFQKVEMHRTEQNDGMSKMIPVSRVILGPNDSVNFQPGDMHLMLLNPKKHHKAGDEIRLTLFFTNENSMKISLPVKKSAPSNHGMHDDQQNTSSHQH